jgi:hypothetical protein
VFPVVTRTGRRFCSSDTRGGSIICPLWNQRGGPFPRSNLSMATTADVRPHPPISSSLAAPATGARETRAAARLPAPCSLLPAPCSCDRPPGTPVPEDARRHPALRPARPGTARGQGGSHGSPAGSWSRSAHTSAAHHAAPRTHGDNHTNGRRTAQHHRKSIRSTGATASKPNAPQRRRVPEKCSQDVSRRSRAAPISGHDETTENPRPPQDRRGQRGQPILRGQQGQRSGGQRDQASSAQSARSPPPRPKT